MEGASEKSEPWTTRYPQRNKRLRYTREERATTAGTAIPSPKKRPTDALPLHTQNRYDALSDSGTDTDEGVDNYDMDSGAPPVVNTRTEGQAQKAPKTLKLPPLVINIKNAPQDVKNKTIKDLNQNNVTIKYTPATITVFASTREILKSIQELVAASNLEYHTYTEDGARDKKLAIKGLPPLETEEIILSLEEQGVTPKKLVQLKHRKTKRKSNILPLCSPRVELGRNHQHQIRMQCQSKMGKVQKPTQSYTVPQMPGHGARIWQLPPQTEMCQMRRGTHNDRVL